MHVKQAANVLALLEYFAQRQRPATLAEIADDLQWPRSSTFNLIGTLVDKGYLYEPKLRSGYYPTLRWLTFSQAVAEGQPLPEALYAMTDFVAGKTGETTAISAPSGASALFVHVVESKLPLRYFAQIGDRLPIHASSVGRALLAQYTPDELQALFRKIRFEQYSSTSPMSIDEIQGKLQRAKARGYHQSESEYLPDLAGVALPIPLPSRRLSIVVAGPLSRCMDRRPQIAEILQTAIKTYIHDDVA